MGRAAVHMTPHGMFPKAEGIALLRQLTPIDRREDRRGAQRLVTFSPSQPIVVPSQFLSMRLTGGRYNLKGGRIYISGA